MLASGKRALPRRIFRLTLLALALGGATHIAAQGRYPERPIRLVIPFAPGGETDIFSRAIAPRLADVLGQQVVLENRAGATGIVGSEYVAKARPDGYTLIFGTAAAQCVSSATISLLSNTGARGLPCQASMSALRSAKAGGRFAKPGVRSHRRSKCRLRSGSG